MKKLILLVFLIILNLFAQKPEFLSWAETPPMGWNSWDCFGPTVTEDEVKANADYMSEHLLEYGWEYIVVDIRWYIENDKSHGYNETDAVFVMDNYGRLQPAVNRFPSAADGKGFKPLADYVHSKGLKFGIHIMRGIPKIAVEKNTPILGTDIKAQEIYNTNLLCKWLGDMYTVDATKIGAQEYYDSLFEMYAEWGIDFIKIDDLSRPYHQAEIELIRNSINKCGRPIVLSTSPGETPIESAQHVKTHANMWRIIDDFWDNWSQLSEHFALFEKWIPHMGTGHWPDGDMLPMGHIGIRAERGDDRMSQFTKDEHYTLMSLFLICRSPLMFGGHLPDNDEFTKSLLTNQEALDVLQKSTNNRLLFNNDEKIAWIADATDSNDKYLALFYAAGQKPIQENLALYTSPLITHRPGEQSAKIKVDINGAKKLYLVATDGGDGTGWDHVDWIEPTLSGSKGTVQLTDIKWVKATSGWETVKINKSIGGNDLIVNDTIYENGIGTHTTSIIEYDIPDGYDTFSSIVGMDKECIEHTEGATAKFHIFTQYPTGLPPLDSIDIKIELAQLGMNSKVKIRDLWEHKDLGEFSCDFTTIVNKHGAKLYKIQNAD